MKIYKLRNKTTGLYWAGGGYLSPVWGKQGKMYWRLTDLKNSFKQAQRRHRESPRNPEECELLIWHVDSPHEVQEFVL